MGRLSNLKKVSRESERKKRARKLIQDSGLADDLELKKTPERIKRIQQAPIKGAEKGQEKGSIVALKGQEKISFKEAKTGADKATKPLAKIKATKPLKEPEPIPSKPKDIFEWRKLILSDVGPSRGGTRFFLLLLSTYMQKDGTNCFPSVKTLAHVSAMTERWVCDHIEYALKEKWIEIKRLGKGKNWRLNTYIPAIPDKTLRKSQQQINGTEKISAAKISVNDLAEGQRIWESHGQAAFIEYAKAKKWSKHDIESLLNKMKGTENISAP